MIIIFEEAMQRIYAETGTRTQLELAELLSIRQSSVSDAKRRSRIPDGWLVVLVEKFSLNPDWVRTGMGIKYLVLSDDKDKLVLDSQRKELREEILLDLLSDPTSVTHEMACQLLLCHYPAGTVLRPVTPEIKA